MRHLIAGAVVSLGTFASAASAGLGGSDGVLWLDDAGLWVDAPAFIKDYPASWVTDTFISPVGAITSPGTYASLSGGKGWYAWTLTAVGSTLSANGSIVSSVKSGAPLRIDFGGASGPDGSGVHGVGGNFRLVDASGSFLGGELALTLSNGDAFVRQFTKDQPFGGFWTTDPSLTITSMTVSAYGLVPPSYSIGIQDLYLGYAGVPVPGPASAALLAAAGLIRASRRR